MGKWDSREPSTRTKYTYDAEGRRAQKTVAGAWTAHIHNLSGKPVTEIHASSWSPGCVYLGGTLVAEYANATTDFVHQDDLNSTRVVTGLNQAIVQNLDYLPFGEILSSDSGITSHKLSGDHRDSETGLDHTWSRQYSSNFGRWMTPDLLGGSIDNPQSFNR
jgi:RHS repeat-associated protein